MLTIGSISRGCEIYVYGGVKGTWVGCYVTPTGGLWDEEDCLQKKAGKLSNIQQPLKSTIGDILVQHSITIDNYFRDGDTASTPAQPKAFLAILTGRAVWMTVMVILIAKDLRS